LSDVDGFFLTEVFPAEPPPRERRRLLPGIRLRPIDAGYILRWREIPPDGQGPYWRTGVVVAPAPRPRSVWVQPDDQRAGEGWAVVVDNVSAEECADAERRLGVPGDLLSTRGWQSPRTLRRAVLRADWERYGDVVRVHRYLHAAPGCAYPSVSFMADGCGRGPETPVEECYVTHGYLHPVSVRPVDPDRRDSYVEPCPGCLIVNCPE
jgi:hypothetical protein